MQRGLLLALVVFLLVGCGRSVQLESADAGKILATVAEHQGREAVLVNFWATWCAPCVEEFPMIVELSDSYRSRGLVTYFVSVDWLDQRKQVETFLAGQSVAGLSFIKDQKDNPFIDGIWTAWTGAVPFTLLYGRESGEVIDFWEGAAPRERFESAIPMALDN